MMHLLSQPGLRLRVALAALAVSLICLVTRFALTQSFLAGDSVRHYIILRSLLIDGDLDFRNEYSHYAAARSPYTGNPKLLWVPPAHPQTGRLSVEKPIGLALALSPFFLLAHLMSRL